MSPAVIDALPSLLTRMYRLARAPLSFLALALAAAAFLGCERAKPLETDDSVSFSTIQENVFNSSCALSGCHRGPASPEGLDLSAGNAYENLVGVASEQVPELDRVDPGNPDDSYLIIKLEGGDRMADGSARMPRGREPLPEDQIDLIRTWIEKGAPRDSEG